MAAAVVEVSPEVRELLADIEVLDQLAAELGEDDARQVEILLALEAALDALDLADVPATASTAREALAAVLGAAGVRRRPPRLRRRARAHRLGLAVAGPRDGAQGGPHASRTW